MNHYPDMHGRNFKWHMNHEQIERFFCPNDEAVHLTPPPKRDWGKLAFAIALLVTLVTCANVVFGQAPRVSTNADKPVLEIYLEGRCNPCRQFDHVYFTDGNFQDAITSRFDVELYRIDKDQDAEKRFRSHELKSVPAFVSQDYPELRIEGYSGDPNVLFKKLQVMHHSILMKRKGERAQQQESKPQRYRRSDENAPPERAAPTQVWEIDRGKHVPTSGQSSEVPWGDVHLVVFIPKILETNGPLANHLLLMAEDFKGLVSRKTDGKATVSLVPERTAPDAFQQGVQYLGIDPEKPHVVALVAKRDLGIKGIVVGGVEKMLSGFHILKDVPVSLYAERVHSRAYRTGVQIAKSAESQKPDEASGGGDWQIMSIIAGLAFLIAERLGLGKLVGFVKRKFFPGKKPSRSKK